jgi:hypothetical protein
MQVVGDETKKQADSLENLVFLPSSISEFFFKRHKYKASSKF